MAASKALRENPFAGDLFVFAPSTDRAKILAWDGTSLCRFHKRPESARFVWPPVQDGAIPATWAAAGGSGVVAGAAKAIDCAIIGR